MKKKLFHVVILLVMVAGLGIPASSVAAESISTPVTAFEIPLCPPWVPPPYHPDCGAGEWSFPGGNQHVRNWIQIYNVIGLNDDRVTGTNTLLTNANFDENGYGPGWGTFHNESSIYNGYWEGTWTAVMDETGYVSKIAGKGYGAFDGLLFRATEVNGLLEGVIIELSAN